MNTGEKIKTLRRERSMTQAALAGTHITRNMLSLIESGSATPSLDTVTYLAKRLGVSAGYLLADDGEEYFYRKNTGITRIKHAYSDRDFALCRELCLSVASGDAPDDEIALLLAESSLGLAKEMFCAGRLHGACDEFENACEYSEKTIYPTGHIKAESRVYCRYMSGISPSLYSGDGDETCSGLADGDDYCRYIIAAEAVVAGDEAEAERYIERQDFLSDHIRAKLLIKHGESGEAGKLILALLNGKDELSGAVMYDMFCELEKCCRETGDYKGAYEYSNAKVVMLERLLAEEV